MFSKVGKVMASGAVLVLVASAAHAGGAWVPDRGAGDLQVGYSVKTADSSWNRQGDTVQNSSWHIFRYVYNGGEAGLGRGFSFRYLVLYLDGLEGPRGDMEHNAGLSEAFLGVKVRLKEGTWPMAVAFNLRTSYLYDEPGTYNRHNFRPDSTDVDGDGNRTEAVFNGVSSEWRGLLGEDYGLSFLISRSLPRGGWFNAEVGYNYRTTNLGDEIPLYVEVGYPLPWQSLVLKGSYRWVQSVGNPTVGPRDPEDRFGCTATNCGFPDASFMALGAGFFRDFGAEKKWWLEAGYNQWIWGRSARQYGEPYLSVGRRF